MQNTSRGRLLAAAAVAWMASGCAISISLDNPYPYRTLGTPERLGVACVYHLTTPAPGTMLEKDNYKIDLARAVSGQVRAALLGLCRGARESKEPPEAILRAAKGPLLVLDVGVTAGMSATAVTWAVNTGWVSGTASVVGGGTSSQPRGYEFSAKGKRRTYYAEAGVGAEGLRNALGLAIQDLVDQLSKDRAELLRLAGVPEATGDAPAR